MHNVRAVSFSFFEASSPGDSLSDGSEELLRGEESVCAWFWGRSTCTQVDSSEKVTDSHEEQRSQLMVLDLPKEEKMQEPKFIKKNFFWLLSGGFILFSIQIHHFVITSSLNPWVDFPLPKTECTYLILL